MLDYIDENLAECVDDFTLTKEFLNLKNINFDDSRYWFVENGAFFDCEILANIGKIVEEM